MTRGLRDQENIRINNILARMLSIPPDQISVINDELKGLALQLDVLDTMSASDVVNHLNRLHFDFSNKELFADFLVHHSQASNSQKSDFREKAIFVYKHIQSENTVYSVAIQNKLQALN